MVSIQVLAILPVTTLAELMDEVKIFEDIKMNCYWEVKIDLAYFGSVSE